MTFVLCVDLNIFQFLGYFFVNTWCYMHMVVYIHGKYIKLFKLLLTYLAILYNGACMLFTIGLNGSFGCHWFVLNNLLIEQL